LVACFTLMLSHLRTFHSCLWLHPWHLLGFQR
jgi:hypothetical protein